MTDLVELSWPELRGAAHMGIDRFVRNRAAGRTPLDGQVAADAWRDDVLGAWGECVVAKRVDRFWMGDLARPDGGAADVGGRFHVRTASEPGRRLILHERDDDAAVFVLVVPVRLPTFQVVGWCYGNEGKRPEYWQTHTGRPCYMVPTTALRPIGELT